MLTHTRYRIGDTVRFPLGRLGDHDVYRYRYAITAFRPDGCVICRRLHDGLERTVSEYWIERYETPETETARYALRPTDGTRSIARQHAREHIRAARLRMAQQNRQTDPQAPGFYVSALDRSRDRYALILGPFRDLYTALQMVRDGRRLAAPYDGWNSYAYGTCRTETSERPGKLNPEYLGA